MMVIWEEEKEDWRGSGTGMVPEKHFAVSICSSWLFIGWNATI